MLSAKYDHPPSIGKPLLIVDAKWMLFAERSRLLIRFWEETTTAMSINFTHRFCCTRKISARFFLLNSKKKINFEFQTEENHKNLTGRMMLLVELPQNTG